ncbi:hypothetical protein P5V15_011857 [Pogonomyrmex californicus]
MPFRNLRLTIMLNKILGLVSCKLVNGQFKPGSKWNCCFCMLWFLFHCWYTSVFYHLSYIAPPDVKNQNGFVLSIVRFSAFTVSLLPYHFVAAFRNKDFVKFSNKLLTYDEQATALGYQRKDKHIFIYLYFMYTLTTILFKSYFNFNDIMFSEIILVVTTVLHETIPTVVGTYCVFITCIFLDLIRQRFRHLNEIIVPQVSPLPVTGSQGEITVYQVRYLHGVLLDSADLINKLYGIGTLFTFGSILLECISVLYAFLTKAQKDGPVILMDLLFQIIFLFAMYHFTTYEANRVERRVIQYGLPFSNKKYRMDKIEMMLYFYHRRYAFTAAEFFVLDLTILLPIATTVTTYLTLLV